MSQPTAQIAAPMLTHLVVADGMKDVAEWNAYTLESKAAWLAALSDLEVRAQASVLAVAARRPVTAIINAWQALGLLDAARAVAVMQARGF